MPTKSDPELLEAARRGDIEAFAAIVRRHQKRIYRIALHLLRDADDAQDVTQEAFVRAYAGLDRFDGRCQPFTWMYRITVNLSLNALRSRKSRRKAVSSDDPRVDEIVNEGRHGGPGPDSQAADHQLALALCEGIDGLSDTLRTTLVLVIVDGLSHAQAAEVLGCPEGTVAWRIHEARRKLREHLTSRGFGTEATRS
jgi:RNA polymerase sigma-70 factor (ECF subfamily)